jgi:hypothetical protein
MRYKKQVSNRNYVYGKYLHASRWMSYFYQIDSVQKINQETRKKPSDVSILEIGPGDGTVSSLLKSWKYRLTTMDIAKDIHPDIVASLPLIPLKHKVDIILCCEVLEHIQYHDVEKSLKNMAKKCDYAIISIPHKSLYISCVLRFPMLNPKKIFFSFPAFFIKHKFDGQHYWELGTKGYSTSRFKESLTNAGFRLLKNFRVIEFPYHHFFIVKSI